jgi:hypothetical protein
MGLGGEAIRGALSTAQHRIPEAVCHRHNVISHPHVTSLQILGRDHGPKIRGTQQFGHRLAIPVLDVPNEPGGLVGLAARAR